MNRLYIESAFQDRERQVEEYAKYNQINRRNQKSNSDKQSAAEKGMGGLSLMWLEITRHLRNIFARISADRIEI